MSLPAACRDCKREGKQIEYCNVRTYQFAALLRKCPREPGFEPTKPATTDIRSIHMVKAEATEKTIGVTSDKIMVSNIPIDKLEFGAFSPRMQFDPNYVTKLAEDIEAEGQLKPIMVRPHPAKPDTFQIIDGEHRVRALKKLGKTLVRAEVHALSDEEAFYRAMRINQLHGKSLEELEEACHINKMMGLFSLTETQIGERFSRSQEWVSKRISLATSLSQKVEDNVITRVITSRHAIEIAELPKEDQEKVVAIVAKEKLSTRATEGLVHAVKEAGTPEQKEKILAKSMKLYSNTFKDPKQMKTALLTIKPDDDFLAKTEEIKTEEQAKEFFAESKPEEAAETFQCPGCGKQLRVDWAKGEVQWD